MAKKNIDKKKEVEIKAEKTIIATPKNKSIDWSSMGSEVVVTGLGGKHLLKGVKYAVTKEIAKILITNGSAKL